MSDGRETPRPDEQTGVRLSPAPPEQEALRLARFAELLAASTEPRHTLPREDREKLEQVGDTIRHLYALVWHFQRLAASSAPEQEAPLRSADWSRQWRERAETLCTMAASGVVVRSPAELVAGMRALQDDQAAEQEAPLTDQSLFSLATNWASACMSASHEYYSESKQAVIDRAREAFIRALAASERAPVSASATLHLYRDPESGELLGETSDERKRRRATGADSPEPARDAARLDWLDRYKGPDLNINLWKSLLGLWIVDVGNGDEFEGFETERIVEGERSVRAAIDAAMTMAAPSAVESRASSDPTDAEIPSGLSLDADAHPITPGSPPSGSGSSSNTGA